MELPLEILCKIMQHCDPKTKYQFLFIPLTHHEAKRLLKPTITYECSTFNFDDYDDVMVLTWEYKEYKLKIKYLSRTQLKCKVQHYTNGLLHRKEGPASVKYSISMQPEFEKWYKNVLLHRDTGPAVIRYFTGVMQYEQWYFGGKTQIYDIPSDIVVQIANKFMTELNQLGNFNFAYEFNSHFNHITYKNDKGTIRFELLLLGSYRSNRINKTSVRVEIKCVNCQSATDFIIPFSDLCSLESFSFHTFIDFDRVNEQFAT